MKRAIIEGALAAKVGDMASCEEVLFAPVEPFVTQPCADAPDVAESYARLRAERSSGVFLARTREEAFEHVCRSYREGNETLLFTGSTLARQAIVGNPLGQLLGKLPAARKIWIGQGSNTWKSDLNLAVSYVRTQGPANALGATLGIPWMAGIPGTVGGWIKMNAGAFGHSISEVLEAVCVDGEWRKAEDCGFAYRHSDIKGEISDFRLRQPSALKTEGTASDYLARRRKFPAHTFGSFFKNPPGDFAGRILEASGAKELRVGGAYVWQEHANVIVAGEGSTPSDVLALSRLMRIRAYRSSGIWLQPEVQGIL